MALHGRHTETGVGMLWMFLGCVVCFLGLLVGGLFMLVHEQAKWGWTALALALYGLVFVMLALNYLTNCSTGSS